MIFKIVKAIPVKEFIIRFSVELYEYQGPCEVLHSNYDIALDTQPYVKAETVDNGIHLDIDMDGVLQELTNSITSLQLTSGVAQRLLGAKWQVEEEKKDEQLSDQS